MLVKVSKAMLHEEEQTRNKWADEKQKKVSLLLEV